MTYFCLFLRDQLIQLHLLLTPDLYKCITVTEIPDSSHLWLRSRVSNGKYHILTSEKETAPWMYLGFEHQKQTSGSALEIVLHLTNTKWIFLQCQWELTFLIALCSTGPQEENVQVLAISTIRRYSLISMIPEQIQLSVGFQSMCQKKHLTFTCTCVCITHMTECMKQKSTN